MRLPGILGRRFFALFLIYGVISVCTATGDDSDCRGKGHVSPGGNRRKCPSSTQLVDGCCLKCTKCAAGYHKLNATCTADCIPCKEGTFRMDGHPQTLCYPCKNCGDFFHRVYNITCEGNHNSKCGKCKQGFYENPDVYESERLHRDCLKCRPDTPDDGCRDYYVNHFTTPADVVNQGLITLSPPAVLQEAVPPHPDRTQEVKGVATGTSLSGAALFGVTFSCTFLLAVVALLSVVLGVTRRSSKQPTTVQGPNEAPGDPTTKLLQGPTVVVHNPIYINSNRSSVSQDEQFGIPDRQEASNSSTNIPTQEDEITVNAEKETFPMESFAVVPTGYP